MKFKEKCRLVKVFEAIDEILGDTDPDLDDMTEAEIREHEPLMWVIREVGRLIGPTPWDKYSDLEPSGEGEL